MEKPVEKILSIRGLSKQFGDIQAVDNLDLDIYKGDIYGFLGPNGSGKSTSIRLILSLVRPDSGSIQIFGQPVKKFLPRILQRIGALVEKPDFYEYLSAYKNLAILMQYSGLKPNRKRIMEVLEMVGLQDRAKGKVKTYSKGMKQRLGIAQAMLHDPELLILDEPSSGLDPAGARDTRDLLVNLNKDHGKTIMLSSHHLLEIQQVASRMIIISKGKSVLEGSVQELIAGKNLETLFLDLT
ncbi:MAG: ATP-binding cassette domain-containing protein [Bacteroidota bacterium]|nr:ATP-binding cassette domain-containing protein [Bacteroidota bacterium]